MKAWELKKGFTIVELIVTITVIGILATIMIVSYNGIQQRSRDSQRSSDITQLKIAIEKYKADNSQYPPACAGGDGSECTADSLSTTLSSYLNDIPNDPRNLANSATDYRYIRGATTTDSYGILVSYEAKAACKTGQNVITSWWGVSVPTC